MFNERIAWPYRGGEANNPRNSPHVEVSVSSRRCRTAGSSPSLKQNSKSESDDVADKKLRKGYVLDFIAV